MRNRVRLVFPLGVLLAGVFAGPAAAQTAPKPDPAIRDVLLREWTQIGEKIVAMAEDFPEDKYDFRPVPGVRSFAEVMRHAAFWNQFVAKTVRGEPVDPKINELSRADYPTKASIVKVLRSSLQDAASVLRSQPPTPVVKLQGLFVTFIEHAGEHYGQLVVYYRLNGIVPPESRKAGGD